MSDIQEQVQETLEELVASGAELGIQAVAYRDGVKVVDAVAGVVAPDGSPVTPGTVFYNFSIGKGVMSTLVHQEVDRGAFGYDTPVVELWPEFGAHGKEGVTVRHVLTHTAGVPGIPLTSTISDVSTWQTMTRALEDAELWGSQALRLAITPTHSDIWRARSSAAALACRSPRCCMTGSLRLWASPTRSSSACRCVSEGLWRRSSMRRVKSTGR